MATWAYPPLPAEQINHEADTALVRYPDCEPHPIVLYW